MAEQERRKMEALMKHIQDLQISFSDRQATMLANDAKIPESKAFMFSIFCVILIQTNFYGE